MSQNSIKSIFGLFWTLSPTRMGLLLKLGLFISSLDIGPYIQPTCGPLYTFLGPFWGAQMPQNSIRKTIFWLFWTITPTRMGLLIWLRAYFLAKTLGHISCRLIGICISFWVRIGVPKCPKTALKNYFLVVLDHFLYKSGPVDLVRDLFSS
jgi:hypothetical protein